MAYRNKRIVDILSEIFGFPRKYTHGEAEIDYNCPYCDGGKNKFNLSINTEVGIFHCWSCHYKGKLRFLFREHGNSRQQQIYESEAPIASLSTPSKSTVAEDASDSSVSLGSYRSLRFDWKDSHHYLFAINYLKSRGITREIIDEWDICYSEKGPNKYRILIPSRGIDGKLEYFVARSFYDFVEPKYKNPHIPKSNFIFGESKINWKTPVVITEGVMDSLVLWNSVPLLGTDIRPYKRLIKTIIKNATPVIVALDSTASEEAKRVYKILDDFGANVRITWIPREYDDLNGAFTLGGEDAVMNILNSAHRMTTTELILNEDIARLGRSHKVKPTPRRV